MGPFLALALDARISSHFWGRNCAGGIARGLMKSNEEGLGGGELCNWERETAWLVMAVPSSG